MADEEIIRGKHIDDFQEVTKPDEGLGEEIDKILVSFGNFMSGYDAEGKELDINEALDQILSKAQAHYEAENKELGLLFESAILGVDEINDWSEDGLKNFRKQIMPLIDKHCKKLKAGNLGILYKYLEKKDAECDKRVREIFEEIEDYRQNLAPVYKEAEMWICISARDFQDFKSKTLEALRKGEG
jgi:hypothetical protein